ncbi:MAG: sulfatase-like hydrolase/transferase [Akkermansiaceae bacterium]|nr:sulfatase-like hydrolase/transferase [Akkermansiaceae bacterium]
MTFVAEHPTEDPYTGPGGPDIIVIIADDQRWDATSYMQSTIGASGRTARFPWLASPTARTPNMDRLTNEGVHFNNAFVVFSICSPSRATMLTGQYPHIHGVTDNFTDFPASGETYATLLQAEDYATGYFGKWHMGTQQQRPGFDAAVTFNGQGTYFSTEFFDELGDLLFTTSATDWVDDVSTQNAIDFITAKNATGRPFLAVLGFKTPHQPWQPPARTSGLFSTDTPASVPNLTVPPPFAPGANGGSDLGELRDYMRTVVGIDQNIGGVLTHLDTLGIANDTAVFYVSDNGFFRGEHGLGDKRAAYEESLRVPLMIRYPVVQPGPLLVDQIALNLDLAPTILDIAGVPIPAGMQGRSLLPFLTGSVPPDWRDSFIFSYNIDPEFPAANVVPHLGLRRSDGLKLVYYADDASWHELYDASDDADPYEISNEFASPSYASDLESLDAEMFETAEELGFLKITESSPGSQGGSMTVQSGDASLFQIENSPDMANWQVSGTFEGGGTPTTLSLINAGFTSSQTVNGDAADYVLAEGPPVTAVQGIDTLRVGSITPVGGRNAVLVFELPVVAAPLQVALAELEVTVVRTFAQWDADLWVLGIRDNTTPVLEYSETPSGNPDVIKLQDAICDFTTSNAGQTVTSSPISGLTRYLQAFYEENSSYAGGKYIFLRVNPTADIGVNNQRYTISAAENATAADRPKLNLYFKQPAANPPKQFYRLRYGTTGTPAP